MSEDSSCTICGYKSQAETEAGSESVNSDLNDPDCKHCEEYLQTAQEHLEGCMRVGQLQPRLALSFCRDQLPVIALNRRGPLAALNLCISWLDRESRGCDTHPSWHPAIGLQDLSRYKKEDFDSAAGPPFSIQGHRHSELLYTGALASFGVYGPCEFALSWLRHAHQANRHILPLLLGGAAAADYEDFTRWIWSPRYHAQLGRPSWGATPGALEWLKDSVEDLARRPCDGPGCREVENRPGVLATCGRCNEACYCGVECQKLDWVKGGHKKWCGLKPPGSLKW